MDGRTGKTCNGAWVHAAAVCVRQEGYLFLYKAMESLCNDEETCVAGDRDSGIANCNNYSVSAHPAAPAPPASPHVESACHEQLAEDASSQPHSPPKASPSSPTPQTADVPPPYEALQLWIERPPPRVDSGIAG